MKSKFIFLLLSIFLFIHSSASAAEINEKQFGDFIYSISNDTVSILKYNGSDENITIPSKIEGLQVTSIGEKAFESNLYVKNVIVSNGMLTIKENAFSGCTNLEEILLPEGLSEIANWTFHGCINLKSVTLPASILTVHGYAFAESGIEELVIPEGVKYIDGSFYICSKLKSVNLPATLEIIYPDEHIGLFYLCKSLAKINVAKENPYYFSKGGVFFQRDTAIEGGKRQYLYSYPASKPGKKYTVPKDTYIMVCAFDSCEYLRSLIIPEGINNVSIIASNCNKMTVSIPRSVTTFPSNGHENDYPIFKDCINCLAKVHKGSPIYKYCKKNKIPFTLFNDKKR
jgi:hypothetical protein